MMQIKSSDKEMVDVVKKIIEKQYDRHHTYEDLAQLVGTNVTKLQFVFKAITGRNIYEYRTCIRLTKALELIETTELKIEVIAGKVGLDRSNLNRQFKKIYGKSPRNWRIEKCKETGID